MGCGRGAWGINNGLAPKASDLKMRYLLATLSIAALVSTSTAQASSTCTGCNLVDEGRLSASLVGETVYLDHQAYQVDAVDTASGQVVVRDSAGQAWQGKARLFYSPGAQRERDTAWVVGGVAALGLACVLMGCGRSPGGSSTSDAHQNRQATTYYWRSEAAEAPRSTTPDTSVGCAWGDRAYGTCH